MFTARRLKKARKEARQQLARAARELLVAPTDAGLGADQPRFKPEVDRGAADLLRDLETAAAGEDIILIETRTRELKQLVDEHAPVWRSSIVTEYGEAIVVALVLAMVIRTFIVQAFKIPSGSMIPTLRVGDHILVNKFIYGLPVPFADKKVLSFHRPERGDIIVFKFPQDQSKDYIKRVIGIPGDTIEVRGDRLYVNGREVTRTLVGPYRYEDPRTFDQSSKLFRETIDGHEHDVLYDVQGFRMDVVKKVPPGQYFCMGDNRDHSNDSRFWGFVPFELIKGKAMVIYFSWPPGQFVRIGHLVK